MTEEEKAIHVAETRWIGPDHGYEVVCSLCGEIYPCKVIRSME